MTSLAQEVNDAQTSEEFMSLAAFTCAFSAEGVAAAAAGLAQRAAQPTAYASFAPRAGELSRLQVAPELFAHARTAVLSMPEPSVEEHAALAALAKGLVPAAILRLLDGARNAAAKATAGAHVDVAASAEGAALAAYLGDNTSKPKPALSLAFALEAKSQVIAAASAGGLRESAGASTANQQSPGLFVKLEQAVADFAAKFSVLGGDDGSRAQAFCGLGAAGAGRAAGFAPLTVEEARAMLDGVTKNQFQLRLPPWDKSDNVYSRFKQNTGAGGGPGSSVFLAIEALHKSLNGDIKAVKDIVTGKTAQQPGAAAAAAAVLQAHAAAVAVVRIFIELCARLGRRFVITLEYGAAVGTKVAAMPFLVGDAANIALAPGRFEALVLVTAEPSVIAKILVSPTAAFEVNELGGTFGNTAILQVRSDAKDGVRSVACRQDILEPHMRPVGYRLAPSLSIAGSGTYRDILFGMRQGDDTTPHECEGRSVECALGYPMAGTKSAVVIARVKGVQFARDIAFAAAFAASLRRT
jgi:hypothetical protein